MKSCQQCQTPLTEELKKNVEHYQISINQDLFDQLTEDIKSLSITQWEKMILVRQINLLRFNCRKLNVLIC